MSKLTEYRELVKSVRSQLGYWKSYSLLQFTISLGRIMRADKVSGKKLAKLLGVSSQQVSKVLGGGENITVETMAKFARVLDSVVHIHVAKRGVAVRWVEGATPTERPEERVSLPVERGTTSNTLVVFRPSLPANANYVN